MSIITRDQWKAKPSNWPLKPFKGQPLAVAVLHHSVTSTGGANPAATVRAIQRDHLSSSRGFSDIAYNLLVGGANGAIYEGRGLEFHGGATTPAANPSTLALCALGNYHRAKPTTALLNGLAEAMYLAVCGGALSPTFELHSHRQYSATACPGKHLQAMLGALRAAAQLKIDQSTELAPTLSLEARVERLERHAGLGTP